MNKKAMHRVRTSLLAEGASPYTFATATEDKSGGTRYTPQVEKPTHLLLAE